jgi:hypothetical protein
MTEAEDMRDLARRIEDLAREHRAHSMAWEIIRNCTHHLTAVARTMECNAQHDVPKKRSRRPR